MAHPSVALQHYSGHSSSSKRIAATLPDELDAAICRHGGIAIADEVQVGFGRLGEWFGQPPIGQLASDALDRSY